MQTCAKSRNFCRRAEFFKFSEFEDYCKIPLDMATTINKIQYLQKLLPLKHNYRIYVIKIQSILSAPLKQRSP